MICNTYLSGYRKGKMVGLHGSFIGKPRCNVLVAFGVLTLILISLLATMETDWHPYSKSIFKGFYNGNEIGVSEQQQFSINGEGATSKITITTSETTLKSIANAASELTTNAETATLKSAVVFEFLSNTTDTTIFASSTLLPCNWTTDTFTKPTRKTAALSCSQYHFLNRTMSQSSIAFEQVNADVTPSLTSLNDTSCLKRVIRDHCTHASLRVPRVVHYVQFGDNTMTLEHFISVLSATKFIQPCLIVIHGDVILAGPYWQATLNLVHNIVHVQYTRPTEIFGHKIRYLAHSADVARLRILEDYGGIYMDRDQFALRVLDEFYNESMVISKEIAGTNCGNGFLLAEPGAPFLRHWLNNYTDFNPRQWAVHSTIRPYLLSKDLPHLVRVIHSFFKPDYKQVRAFFDRKKTPSYDWTQQHGFHLYHNRVQDLFDKERIDLQDNVIGEVVRYILYGDKDGCMERE